MTWLASTAMASGGTWLDAGVAWWVMAAWVAVVLVYGLYRSAGEASQDAIRPSGPFPENAD